jgi:hypothetical protein
MLVDLLNKRKKLVLQKWFDAVLKTYPADGRKFLGDQRNRFRNPVGASLYEGIDGLYQRLLDGTDLESDEFAQLLDRIVRIRAVQEFSPSQALGFLFPLKNVIREVVQAEAPEKGIGEELVALERRIDQLVLLSFDKYMECRERLFEIRIREIKASTCRTWERICRKYGDPATWSDAEQGQLTIQDNRGGDG